MAKVSVIIPNYNHASFLEQRIESVLQQTFSDFELIILDDRSSDNSRDIIEKYRHSKKVTGIVYNDSNTGSTFKQWEKGISLSSGKYIWIAESDDFADKDFLKICMHQFDLHPDLALVYTDSCIVNEQNDVLQANLDFLYNRIMPGKWDQSYIGNGKMEILDVLSKENTIPNASAVVFKRVFHKEITKFRFCGDWLFWIKILGKSGQIAFVRQSLNYFRSHNNTTRHSTNSLSKTRRFLKEQSMILFYLKKNRLIDPAFAEVRKKEIVDMWKNIFKITDVLKKDFFVPASNPFYLIKFVTHKLKNAGRKLSTKYSNAF